MGEEALLELHSFLVDETNASTFESRHVPRLEEIVDSISDKKLNKIINNPIRSLQIIAKGIIEEENETSRLTALEDKVASSASKGEARYSLEDLEHIVEVTQMAREIAEDVYRNCDYDKKETIERLISMAG